MEHSNSTHRGLIMSTLQTAVAAMIAVAAWCWPADDENEDPWAADHLDKDDNL